MLDMRILIIIYILITGFSYSIQSQVLSGKITDVPDGKPLPDVAVILPQHRKGTISGPDGSYSLTLQPGKYRVEARLVGYLPVMKEVVMNGKDSVILDFQLKGKVYEQEQIVVTANKMERELSMVPANITVVSPEKIRESGESNILPVLSAEVPGLFVTARGVTGYGLAAGSAGKISIRGIGGGDASFPVLVLIDGQPQFMGLMGHPLPDTYVADDIEKVEVIKGPASLLYGTNAMGGAINLITRTPQTEGFSLNGKVTGGSFGTLKLHSSAGFRRKGSEGMISYQHDQTDGHRPSSLFRLDNGSIRLRNSFGRWISADATASRSSFRASDPGSVYGSLSDFAHNSHWVDIIRTNCYLSLTDQTPYSEGGVKAYILWGDHRMYDGWKSHDENRGLSIFQGFRISPGSLIHIGFDAKKYGGKGISASLGNKSGQYLSVSETGAYLMADQTLFQTVSLNAGVRWDHHSDFGGTWIPQFGVAWRITPASHAKLWISRGFRNPSIRELYLFPTANPGLKPETLWNHELTFLQGFAGGKANVELTGYIISGENLILTVPNPTAPPPFKNANSGEFNHKGVEMAVRYSLNEHLSFSGSYSYLHMDRPKISSPVHQLSAGGEYRKGKVHFSASLRHIAKLYTLTSPQNVTQTFTLLNSKLAFQLSRHAGLFVAGENLLNQEYQLQYGYPMPGVTFFGGFSFSL
jgi:outer membrane cobalamin receptor